MAASALERTLRIDAEYFQKRFAEAEQRLALVSGSSLTEHVHVSDGNHFTISDAFVEDGVPYFRGQDVSESFFADPARPIGITKEAYDRAYMRRSHLRRGDVLLSIVGTIGAAALIDFDEVATCSCKLAILRPKTTLDALSISPEYLAAFLGSSYGQRRIEQLTRGAVQRGLLLEDMDQLRIPHLRGVESLVAALVHAARRDSKKAQAALAKAESDLLDALGLGNWSPPEPLTYTSSAAAVAKAERLDAAYFAPKYDQIAERLRATGHSLAIGDDHTAFVSRGKQPEYGECGLPVVNSKHVRTNRVLLDAGNRLAPPGRVRIRRGDVLINGTGVGTIGRVAPYLHEQEAVPDNHVTVVRLEGIDPIFLSVFLNSPIGQQQIERMISGSSGQIELYPADIRRVLIWRAPKEVQSCIAACVEQAFSLEAESRRLLVVAKRAVEIAIEDGEAAALAFVAEQETGDANPA